MFMMEVCVVQRKWDVEVAHNNAGSDSSADVNASPSRTASDHSICGE